jgi:hypothetical protein
VIATERVRKKNHAHQLQENKQTIAPITHTQKHRTNREEKKEKMSLKNTIHSVALTIAEKTMADEVKPPPPKPPPLSPVESKALIQIKANLDATIQKIDVLVKFLKTTNALAVPYKKRLDGFDLGDTFHSLKHIQNDLKQHIALIEKEFRT